MSEHDLPTPVRNAIDAVNAGDSDGFVAAFADDGIVDDNGRQFTGRDAIMGWSDRELIGADATVEVSGAQDTEEGVAVDAEVRSSGFNGYSRFAFELEGESIRSMTISA
jgi:SnoaL-like domain